MRRILIILLCPTILGLVAPAARAALAVNSSGTAVTAEGGYGSAIIDTVGGVAYFGSSNTVVVSGKAYSDITPVTLSPFGISSGVGYSPGVTNLTAAAFDDQTRIGYFASDLAPATVEMIPFGSVGSVSSMTFAAGQNFIGTAVVDSTNHFAYFGTLRRPPSSSRCRFPTERM